MALLYHPPRDDKDVAQCAQLLSWSFGFPVAQASDWIDTRIPRHEMRVLRDGDQILGTLTLIRMGQYFAGAPLPMIGIAGVAVAPHARGKGIAAQIMSHSMREIRDEGVTISALYPATAHLYRKVGFELAGLRFNTKIDLRMIHVPRSCLTMRTITPDDLPELKRAYASRVSGLTGPLDRGSYVWGRVFHPRDGDASGFGAYRGDQLEGYVFYTQTRNSKNHYDLSLTDFVWSTPEAATALLGFLREHRSIGDQASFFGPAHDPSLMLLDERCFQSHLADQWMIRLTDVPGAFSQRTYPANVISTFSIHVHDETLIENNGAWRITIRDGKASVEPAREGEVECDVRALAAMFTGFVPASRLAALGRLKAPPAAAHALDAAMAGPDPWMYDMF